MEGASDEERKEAAIRLVRELKEGTRVMLVAEPDNPFDCNAVAVYADYTRMIGYIAHEECTEIHKYLDKHGQGVATVCGNDGHLAFFVNVAGSLHDVYEPLEDRGRILPESPLDKSVLMPVSKKERELEAVIYRFLDTPINEENAPELVKMASIYTPLSRMSICHADDYWRRAAQNKIREIYLKAHELNLSEEQTQLMHSLKDEMRQHVSSMHTTHEHTPELLFIQHLNTMRNDNASYGWLMRQYQDFYLNDDFDHADIKLINTEFNRLRKWFSDMPWTEMRNPKDHYRMALKLNYLGVSRRELYDVFSVLLLLECLEKRLGAEQAEENPLFSRQAMKYWNKLAKTGFVDENHMLANGTTRQQAMYIAEAFAEKLNLKSKWISNQQFD